MNRLILGFLLVSVSAYAGNVTLTQKYGEWTSAEWTNTNVWDTQRVPASGDSALLDLGKDAGSHTLVLTNNLTDSLAAIFPRTRSGTSVTFDGNGFDVAPPTVENNVYANNVLDFQFPVGYAWCSALRYSPADSATKSAPYKLTDPLFIWAQDGSVRTLDFWRGTYNFYDASGSGSTSRALYLNYERDLNASSVIHFHPGTVWQIGKVLQYGHAVTNRWIIEDAAVNVYGVYYATDGRWGDAAKFDSVELTDGATLSVGSTMTVSQNANYTTYLPERLFSIRGGSTFRTAGGVTIAAPKTAVELVDSSWDASSASQNYTLANVADDTQSKLFVSNSVWKLNANLVLGSTAASRSPYPICINESLLESPIGGSWLQIHRVLAGITNSVFASAAGTPWDKKFYLCVGYGAAVTMKNSFVTNAQVRIRHAPANERTELVVDGGAWRPPVVSIGYEGDTTLGTNVLRLVDGTMSLWVDGSHSSKDARVDLGRKSHAALVLEGGRLIAPHVNGGEDGVKGAGATARLTGNGGTIVRSTITSGDTKNWIYGLDVAEVGSKGLRLDTDGYSPTVVQDFTDMADADGVLVKTGYGTLTMTVTKTDVSEVRVEQGALKVNASGENAFATCLVVTNGTTFSLADGKATTLRLTGLKVSDGVLELDANDVLIVDGAADIGRLAVRFATAPVKGTPLSWLQVKGTLSEASQKALRLAACGNTVADGQHVTFDVVYDDQTETWQIVTEAEDDAAPISSTTTWQGGPWASENGWSAGVPTVEKKAVFPADAGRVVVPSGAVVGALSFLGSVELTGADLSVSSAQGAADIAVAGGMVRICCSLVFTASRRTTVSVPAEASLELAGGADGTDLVKSGDGALVVSGDGRAVDAPSFANGLNTLSSSGAVTGAQSLKLGGGTLAVATSATLPTLTVAPSDATKPQIVKTDADVVSGPVDVTGELLKRGAGKLTVDMSGSTAAHVLSTVKTDGTWGDFQGLPHDRSHAYAFPADGSAPADGFAGLTVAEGELVFKSDSTAKQHLVKGSMLVGMYTPDGTAQPSLTLDGAYLKHVGYGHAFVGLHTGASDSFVRSVVFRILNGGTFYCDTLVLGLGCHADNPHTVVLAMTNGTIQATSQNRWSESGCTDYPVQVRTKDSSIFATTCAAYIGGAVDADLDNTVVAANSSACGTFTVSSAASGRIVVRNGARWRITTFNGLAGLKNPLALVFDGGFYEWGTGSHTLSLPAGTDPDLFAFEARGAGLRLKPAVGETLTLTYPVSGTGGIVQEGAGTVVFGEGAYVCTGASRVLAGTLDLSAAGTVTNAVFAAGEGVISGGTLKNARLALNVSDYWVATDGVPCFSGSTFAGVTKVDLTRAQDPLAEPLPTSMLVARYTGAAPDVSGWRLKGTGIRGVAGRFMAADGEVRMAVESRGLMLIVR